MCQMRCTIVIRLSAASTTIQPQGTDPRDPNEDPGAREYQSFADAPMSPPLLCQFRGLRNVPGRTDTKMTADSAIKQAATIHC